MKRLLLLCVLAACDGPSEAIEGPVDGGVVDAAVSLDAGEEVDGGCQAAGALGDWVTDYQKEVVGKLAGESEIVDGVTLQNRATVEARTAARNYILAELLGMGLDAEIDSYDSGGNVVARLPGNDADAPWIVLGAHFDGVEAGPAAADNATGVAIVLAAANHLRDVGCRERNVVFAFFDQEEIGLVGSDDFAAKVERELGDVYAMHNFDMLSFDGDGDRVFELWSPTAFLIDEYSDAAEKLGLGVPSPVDFSSSDHQSFLDVGIAAVGLGEEFVGGDSTSTYHTANDTFANVDFAVLLDATRLGVEVVAREVAGK